MVEQLRDPKFPRMKIYVIDNKSTYQPLLNYLKTIENDVTVLYQEKNYGHKVYERDEIIALGGDKYVVTDPDLLLNPNLPPNFLEIMANLSDEYKTNKMGFALDITNNIDLKRRLDHDAGKTIAEQEKPYWLDRLKNNDYELYKAPIDTTFALINKKYYKKGFLANSIRIAGDFTAVHRPWLKNYKDELLPGEGDNYLTNQNISTTLNRWKTV
jgi:hypothetical protein